MKYCNLLVIISMLCCFFISKGMEEINTEEVINTVEKLTVDYKKLRNRVCRSKYRNEKDRDLYLSHLNNMVQFTQSYIQKFLTTDNEELLCRLQNAYLDAQHARAVVSNEICKSTTNPKEFEVAQKNFDNAVAILDEAANEHRTWGKQGYSKKITKIERKQKSLKSKCPKRKAESGKKNDSRPDERPKKVRKLSSDETNKKPVIVNLDDYNDADVSAEIIAYLQPKRARIHFLSQNCSLYEPHSKELRDEYIKLLADIHNYCNEKLRYWEHNPLRDKTLAYLQESYIGAKITIAEIYGSRKKIDKVATILKETSVRVDQWKMNGKLLADTKIWQYLYAVHSKLLLCLASLEKMPENSQLEENQIQNIFHPASPSIAQEVDFASGGQNAPIVIDEEKSDKMSIPFLLN